jgi:ribosomal protein S18 acetylase RimI-like enzyme
LLDLALRAWEPIFPALKSEVPAFVYTAFYPNGWRERQLADLGKALDSESEGIDVAVDDGRPVGWVCTRFHPEDRMSGIYVLVVDTDCHRRGIGTALMERTSP